MKDQVLRINYFAAHVDDRPGVGAEMGKQLAKEGVNLLALLAYPEASGKTQVDLIPENPDALTKAARKLGLTLSPSKSAFLLQGTDRPGAMAEVLERLGNAKINVRATYGVCSGGNRYGGMLWVDAADVEAATRALGATTAAHHT
jgi:hypothetical protein